MLERWNLRAERMERRWGAFSPRRRAWLAALMLTAAVLALFAGIFAVLPLTGNGLIFHDDDYQQHYPFLMAIGRWLRSLARNSSGAAMFDFSLGFGADRLASLNYYGLGDPLTLLAIMFDEAGTYGCYVLLVMLRHVLAALAFLALCRGLGVRYRHALPAAAAYAFTNYMIAWCALKHPMFANPAIHLPLMLLGAEKRLKGGSPLTLALSTAWSALCGFYFLYMNSLMLLLYALARHFLINRGDGWRTLPRSFGRCVGAYLIGLSMAAVALLPAALGYLGSTRSGVGTGGSLLMWDADVYWAFPISFVSSNGWNNAMTVPVAAMLAVCALFRQRREHRALSAAVIAAMAALLIPAVGWVFNGFAYPSDRWKYGGLLLLCFVMAKFAPEVERGRCGRWYLGALIVWCGVLLVRWKIAGAAVPHIMLIALAIALALGGGIDLLLAGRLHRRLAGLPALDRMAGGALLSAFVAVNLLINGLTLCVDPVMNASAGGDAWPRRSDTSLQALEDASGEFFRTDLTADEYFQYNAPSVTGAASTSVYCSIRPARTAAFMQDLALNTEVSANRTHGLDGRAALEAVWSVKYLTAPSDAQSAVPYGFEQVCDDGRYAVWENALALPAAYVYDGYMLREDYEALSPLEKQWALIQCAVLDEADARFEEVEPVQSAGEIAWRVTALDNAEWDGGALTFGKGGGSVTIQFDGLPDSETYLALTGARFTGDEGQLYVTLESEGDSGLLILPSDGYEYSLRRRDFLNNLGYSQAARTTATLRCSRAATIGLDQLRVLCQPMGELEDILDQRRDETLQIEAAADRLTVHTDFAADRMVAFSVPAVDGWRAEIDGSPAELTANAGALCLVKAPAGAHEVALKYETPGLRIGACISGLGLLALIVWTALRRKFYARGH